MAVLKDVLRPLFHQLCRYHLALQTAWYRVGHQPAPLVGRSLFACPLGRAGHERVAAIVRKFGHEHFDYVFFAWDGAPLQHPDLARAEVHTEAGAKYYFAQRYLSPERCKGYDFIFLWDDDLDVSTFDVHQFLAIMRVNALQLAQPALAEPSYVSHDITRQQPGIGRYTDFVEEMAPVFTASAWARFWRMLEPDWNYWGWGYMDVARSVCGFRSLGIVDSQPIRHLKPVESGRPDVVSEFFRMLAQYPGQRCRKLSYGRLRRI